ncbi:hypothetical protein JZU46_03930, partial [bacterium]|nr:hypothetical protein [bacterium]
GMDGGRLGWGMITLAWQFVGQVSGTLVVFLLWLLMVMTGFGLWRKLEEWLLHLAGETPVLVVSTPVPAEVAPEEQPIKSAASASRKKVAPIPAEFRTSFKSENKKDEKSDKVLTRGEVL